jgi:spermidine/putrescine transport system permease protein
MAIAGASSAPDAAGEGSLGRRAGGGLLGLVTLAVAVGTYTQIGTLGLTLAPAAVLLLCAVPFFIAVGALVRRATGSARVDHRDYPLWLSFPSLSFYASFFLIPLGFLVLFAFSTPIGFGEVAYGFDLGNFDAVIDELYIEVFLRTLRAAAVGTLLIVIVGYPLAYWIARYAAPDRKNLFLLLIVVPFWTSFLIRTYSFLIILSPDFFLSDWLQSLKLTNGPLEVLNTQTALQLGLVYNYLPLFVLPLYATLERMDWHLVDAATDLGASGWASFRQITLRLTAPGLVTGALLVFIPMMGEYIIPIILGGGRVDFIGNVVQRSFLETRDYAFGSALAMMIMTALSFCIVLYLYLSMRSEEAQYG